MSKAKFYKKKKKTPIDVKRSFVLIVSLISLDSINVGLYEILYMTETIFS